MGKSVEIPPSGKTYLFKTGNLECTVLVSSQNLIGRNKIPLSMTNLHYVGFNGYHQCPEKKEGLPKVLEKWTTTVEDGTKIACTHRFVVLETKDFFKIYGVLRDTSKKRLQVLDKPCKIDTFGSCDEYLIASSGRSVWKYNYRDSKWMESKLSFLSEKEKCVWEEAENRILKFSFQQNCPNIILLLSNGSVWLLSEENKIRLLIPYDLERVIDISSGLEHSLILTESGCVLAFGNGSRGQLGHGGLNPAANPVQISALEGLKITKVATGGWHSCAITDSGDLYTWGWNNYGQLSAFNDTEEIGLTALPALVDVGEEPEIKVTDVACGTRHTVACLENGDIYSTGWNTYGQLGVQLQCEKVTKFTKCGVRSGENSKVFCGPWYTILIEGSQ